MDLIGQNIIVFDAEIKNEIDGKNVTWSTHEKMGVSVAVAYDYLTGDFNTYMDDNLGELVERIEQAEMVVGFNTLGFDIPLLSATRIFGPNGGELPKKEVRKDNSYDILYWSRKATGWNETARFPSGLRLDNHLEAMFGIKKTEDGANAPIFWQQGKLGRLISYCLADVAREKRLFEHIWTHGWVKTQAHGQRTVTKPQEILEKWRSETNKQS